MRNGFLFTVFAICLFLTTARAQSTDISFQGRLDNNSQPANADYDFEFRLYDAPTGGNLLGTETQLNIPVAAGVFSVRLSFAPALFNGTNRFLEISVRSAAAPGGYQQLLPRQTLTSVPSAIRSLTSDNALQLGGILASQFVLTNDTRLFNDRNPLANSPNYIQNSNTPQASSNFNVSGNGTVSGTLSGNFVSAGTQFNLGGNRILRASAFNLVLGLGAGIGDLSVGFRNTIVGNGAGTNFGVDGRENSIFGMEAGTNIGNGVANAYFGYRAGFANTGNTNAFFGNLTGNDTTDTSSNTFIGNASGHRTTTGSRNTFLGSTSGSANFTGSDNTVIGHFANVASPDLVFATAIGAGAVVGLSNTILLGRTDGSDRVQIPGQLQLVSLATGGVTSLCRTATAFIATCSSSLRYKNSVQTFTGGMNVVRGLRPITFNWREGGSADIGFAAEEVNAVEPLLVTRNDKGEIEGVKYAQITAVLVNAANEQQEQIDEQRDLIKKQQSEITELKAFICSQNPTAAFCVEKKP